MLEFIRCKRIGSIFIVKLAGEGYFTASTFEFSGQQNAQLFDGPLE
jgi:hypothetical protein